MRGAFGGAHKGLVLRVANAWARFQEYNSLLLPVVQLELGQSFVGELTQRFATMMEWMQSDG